MRNRQYYLSKSLRPISLLQRFQYASLSTFHNCSTSMCKQKETLSPFYYFFDIRTYWINKQMKTFAHHPRVNQFILFTTQFNVPWTRWSNTGLFAYLANRQDKGPYTRTKPSDPRHLAYDFLQDKKERNWMCWGSSFWQDSQWKKVMEFVFDWV